MSMSFNTLQMYVKHAEDDDALMSYDDFSVLDTSFSPIQLPQIILMSV